MTNPKDLYTAYPSPNDPAPVYNPDLNSPDFINPLPVVFANPGHLDPRSFQVFGLSAKPGSTSPIGQFGTGLKYAIAVCLREGCTISIELTRDFTDGQPSGASRVFTFSARPSEFRGQETTEIFCEEEGQPPILLPFTLDLGKHWELWQAFRELESNVRDEGGESGINLQAPTSGPYTIIRVEGEAFRTVYNNRYEYFLHPSFYAKAPRSREAYYSTETTKSFYLKGVRVYESPKDFLFTYDFLDSIPLTEDRTIMSVWSLRAALTRHWLQCEDPDAIFQAVTAPKTTEEHHLEFNDSFHTPCEAFKEAVHRALEQRPLSLNPTARKAAEVDTFDERFIKPLELTDLELQRFERAKSFLHRLGYDTSIYKFRLVDVDSEVAGMAREETIFLTRLAFKKSTLYLASTMLEEYFHLHYNYADHTASFQDFLHDEILRMGERVLGEPL